MIKFATIALALALSAPAMAGTKAAPTQAELEAGDAAVFQRA